MIAMLPSQDCAEHKSTFNQQDRVASTSEPSYNADRGLQSRAGSESSDGSMVCEEALLLRPDTPHPPCLVDKITIIIYQPNTRVFA